MTKEPREYSAPRRAKNQLNVTLATAFALGVLVLSGLMQSWPTGSYIAGALVILAIGGICWWLFGSKSARPLPTDREHARWPYLSKNTLDEIKGRKPR